MLTISDKFDKNIFSQISEIWELTGVGNPERGDNFSNIKKTLSHGGKIYSLLVDEMLVGTCWITHDYRRSYIHHMAVHPQFQNKGYGKALLNEALNYCQELGLQAKLEVHQDNPLAQHLYKSFGFKILDGYQAYIKREIKPK
ncbi:GNAT family N-acetyltransferase [bacterium]|nr:GNAT family N-acetyltransferase [bacterium]